MARSRLTGRRGRVARSGATCLAAKRALSRRSRGLPPDAVAGRGPRSPARTRLAVCVLDIDDFKHRQHRIGQLAGDGVLVEIADAAARDAPSGRPRLPQRRRRVRRDPAGCGPDRRRGPLCPPPGHAAAAAPPRPSRGLSLSAGIAELKPDDDGVSLFERASGRCRGRRRPAREPPRKTPSLGSFGRERRKGASLDCGETPSASPAGLWPSTPRPPPPAERPRPAAPRRSRARERSGRCRRRRSPRAPRGAPAPRRRTSRTAAARPARS